MARKPKTKASKPGQEIAKEIIASRKRALARRAKALNSYRTSLMRQAPVGGRMRMEPLAAAETKGYLVAAGDSWFDYPGKFLARDDVLELLEQAGYDVESAAHAGDSIEAMAYGGNTQLYKLAQCFEKVAQRNAVPKAVLLSGGGNDIAGDEFGMLINDANSPIAGWNDEVVAGVIDQRIATAYRRMLDAITALSQHYAGRKLPILVHGYDYAVPDGRGVLGGFGWLPGPWLQPGFHEKHFVNLPEMTAQIVDLIDRFNTMLKKLAQEPAYKGQVYYVDLRGTLPNTLPSAYKKWWANELHPEPKGFEAVKAKFAEVLDKL
jgi:hypothetical protein